MGRLLFVPKRVAAQKGHRSPVNPLLAGWWEASVVDGSGICGATD